MSLSGGVFRKEARRGGLRYHEALPCCRFHPVLMIYQSLWAVASAACFSIMAAFVKLVSDQYGPVELIFYRSLFGVLFILFVMRKSDVSLKTTRLWDHIVRSSLGILSIALWFFALPRMDFGACMTLTYTTPIFLAAWFIGEALIRHEPPPWRVAGAILAGFAGIVAVVQPSFAADEAMPAMVCILLSIIDMAVYGQMKKLGNLGEPSMRIVFYFTLIGTVSGLAGAFLLEGGLHFPTLKNALGLLGIGLMATLGQIAVTKAFAQGNVLLSSCLGFMAIPFSAIIGFALFADRFSAVALIGMALITISGLAATIFTKREEQEEKARKSAP